MAGFLGDAYLWVKSLHILAVIAWMAGFLYLPRLFVYHCGAEVGSKQSETFKIMERRLLRAIMNPAMVVAWAAGLSLAAHIEAWGEGWFHVKLTLLIVLTALHMIAGRWRRAFAEDDNRHSERFYRVMNEVPALLMIGIVVMAVVKPF
ncbi:protoporphyrinogen oxidase HemJ [Pelagibius litoralis]|uniref:Protoporphyrinogen IX oxidase n=1 Tax=Pelagibius litoralis TaxID=374515 RepID=A0A967F289_9PROT|nr:protoporphyrinogen oxidase HemJ [Pelagibius litoralis]NIA71707.1 protoporphyrinogen oxidase HemJ [Pelagibius litoralis]